MAKVKLNPMFNQISGIVGDFVFRSTSSGETILSRRPDTSNTTWSDAQKAQRERFKQANEYAKAAMAEPRVRAHYQEQAASLNKRPYDLARSDYFKGLNLLDPVGAPPISE